jgi:ATP-binding cassette subfamily C protein/ATP-binding cassette subfamily C protein LapB
MSGSPFLTPRKELPEELISQLLAATADNQNKAAKQFANVLVPLLNAIGWRGDPRHVAEAIPHFANDLDIEGFRNVLANLNFGTEAHSVCQGEIDPNLLPCLFIPDHGAVRVIVSETQNGSQIFDGKLCEYREDFDNGLKGTAFYIFESPMKAEAERLGYRSWMGRIGGRLRIVVVQTLFITLLFNLLSIVTPLFIMSIYDSVIPSGSLSQLFFLGLGVTLAVCFEAGFRALRARSIAYASGRIDHLVGIATFQQVMYLPALQTENAPLGSQISRLKEFEMVRDFFTGPLAEALLDLPFTLLFLFLIAILGGPLAIIPVIVAVFFVCIAATVGPAMRRLNSKSGNVRSAQQRFLVETMANLRSLKLLSAEKPWLERHRRMSAELAEADFRMSLLNQTVQTLSTVMMLSAGVAVISFGAVRVMSLDMSSGALIATMMLGWRALSPLQSGLTALNRADQIRSALTQINRLMRMPIERIPGDVPPLRSVGGGITFSFVSFRYTPESYPALYGVSFAAEPGEIVAITGTNGSGKSTILKLAAGIHKPQAGAVLIDGVDIRQLDAIDLRQRIGFVPQIPVFFHGTIGQNLRMANPMATDAEIEHAAKTADIQAEIMTLPDKFETRLNDVLLNELPAGFKRKLALARAYVRKPPILLLDEPGQSLDSSGDAKFIDLISRLRGEATVLMTTHRPSHMRLADRLILLNEGRVVFNGSPAEYLDRLKENAA